MNFIDGEINNLMLVLPGVAVSYIVGVITLLAASTFWPISALLLLVLKSQ